LKSTKNNGQPELLLLEQRKFSHEIKNIVNITQCNFSSAVRLNDN